VRPILQREYEDLAEEYVRLVKKHFGSRLWSICFFGSAVRGEATSESDLDTLVVADGLPRDIGSRFRETNPIHSNLRQTEAYRKFRSLQRHGTVSDIFLTRREASEHPPILLDMADHGVLAFDRDSFLEGILESVRRKLRELGARKVLTKKGYYWVLKPDAKPTEVVEI